VIRLNPKYAEVHTCRGHSRNKSGLVTKAIEDFDEALRQNPRDADAFVNRGLAREAIEEWGGAIDDFSAAIAVTPKSADALSNRARLRAQCDDAKFRDGAKAVADATLACELTQWKNPHHLEVFGAAHAEAGDFAAAVRWQTKALDDADYAKQHGAAAKRRLKAYRKRCEI